MDGPEETVADVGLVVAVVPVLWEVSECYKVRWIEVLLAVPYSSAVH